MRQVSPRWLKEPPSCSRVDRIVVFFFPFELLFFSLSFLLASRNGSIFLLGPCHKCVISCILFSLEQSRVVDLTVAEDHPDSISESNVLSDEFAQLLSQCIHDFPKQFCCQMTGCRSPSIQCPTTTFCIFRS